MPEKTHVLLGVTGGIAAYKIPNLCSRLVKGGFHVETIGKNGAMLKKISTMARNDCEKFMGTKVYLRCWVKVKENWRDSDFLLKNFGYRDQ